MQITVLISVLTTCIAGLKGWVCSRHDGKKQLSLPEGPSTDTLPVSEKDCSFSLHWILDNQSYDRVALNIALNIGRGCPEVVESPPWRPSEAAWP